MERTTITFRHSRIHTRQSRTKYHLNARTSAAFHLNTLQFIEILASAALYRNALSFIYSITSAAFYLDMGWLRLVGSLKLQVSLKL